MASPSPRPVASHLIPFAGILLIGFLAGSFAMRLATPPPAAPPRVMVIPEQLQGPLIARRPLPHDFSNGDRSFDGRWITFLRTSSVGESTFTSVIVSDSSGAQSRVAHRESGTRLRAPRWSPDGKTIAVTRSDDGSGGTVLLLLVGEAARSLSVPGGGAGLSSGAWVDAKRYVYSVRARSLTPWGDTEGSSIRVHHVKRDRSYEGGWIEGNVLHVDVAREGGLVLEVRGDSLDSRFLYMDRVPGLGRPSR